MVTVVEHGNAASRRRSAGSGRATGGPFRPGNRVPGALGPYLVPTGRNMTVTADHRYRPDHVDIR